MSDYPQTEKNYVGIGWEGKSSVKMAVRIADLAKIPVDKYGQIHLSVVKRKAPDEKSKATHFVIEDTNYWEKHERPAPDASLGGVPVKNIYDYKQPESHY